MAVDPALRHPPADRPPLVEQPHRHPGIGQRSGTGGPRHPSTDNGNGRAQALLTEAGSVSSQMNHTTPLTRSGWRSSQARKASKLKGAAGAVARMTTPLRLSGI